MNGKSFFIDLSRCTACRGCQVACKQWKKLPATPTRNRGSHQNPEDFNFQTLKLVRFEEIEDGGRLQWLFLPDQCRHCVDPPCKAVADGYDDKAVIHDEATGAVVYTEATKNIDVGSPEEMCPYNVPRQDPDTKVWSKCDMCLDRVQNGLLPACVLTCPTGAMHFGDRAEMLAMAEKRLAEIKPRRPQASLASPGSVRVIYLCEFKPTMYSPYNQAEAAPFPLTRKAFFAKLSRPLRVRG